MVEVDFLAADLVVAVGGVGELNNARGNGKNVDIVANVRHIVITKEKKPNTCRMDECHTWYEVS